MSMVSEPSEQTGLTNLMQHYMLEHSYHKFTSKKVKDELSAFLPHLPGNIDTPGSQDNRRVPLLSSCLQLQPDYCFPP